MQEPPSNAADSFRKRYLYKLAANAVGLAISLASQAIVPRTLGPTAYGSFNFLTNFFTNLVSFLEFGSSDFFFTRLCRAPRDRGLLLSLLASAAAVMALSLMGLALALALGGALWIWPDQPTHAIWLSAVYALLSWGFQRLAQVLDAQSKTVWLERLRIAHRILGLACIVLLAVRGALDLRNYLWQHVVLLFLCLVIGVRSIGVDAASGGRYGVIFRDLVGYSHPLFISMVIGFLGNVLDRWLLQYYAGGVEQGYFGLSMQISSLCFLFTSAVTPLLAREYSIAHGATDRKLLRSLFQRFLPVFLVVAAVFSCFLAVQADTVVLLFGGKEYQAATWSVGLMAFYPIHQTYGQLIGSLYLATEQTRRYRDIGVFTTFLGIALTWGLFAGLHGRPGAPSGSSLLAFKMVFLQLTAVHLLLFFACRYLEASFLRFVFHELKVVALFLGLAGGLRAVSPTATTLPGALLVLSLNGGIYVAAVSAILWRFPTFLGFPEDWRKRLALSG